MSILSDKEIFDLCVPSGDVVVPFESEQIREENGKRVISYGLSSYGYDIRLGYEFKVCESIPGVPIDPKDPGHGAIFRDVKTIDYLIIAPNSFVLGHSIERIKVPKDILVLCIGKSTYARCGILVNVTPLEPEWEGIITIEISNTTPAPTKVHAGEGICQLLFFRADNVCRISYANREGRYQNQEGITLACT